MSSLEARRLNHLESAIRAASGEQIVTIERLVAEVASMRVADVALARRTEVTRAERRCPHCRTAGAHLHGKDKNHRQRFRCRTSECRRTFNILTGTPMARARMPEKWGYYLSHMTGHRLVRKIIEVGIGVNHTTVWRWTMATIRAKTSHICPGVGGLAVTPGNRAFSWRTKGCAGPGDRASAHMISRPSQ
jgi:transposase-like protein